MGLSGPVTGDDIEFLRSRNRPGVLSVSVGDVGTGGTAAVGVSGLCSIRYRDATNNLQATRPSGRGLTRFGSVLGLYISSD